MRTTRWQFRHSAAEEGSGEDVTEGGFSLQSEFTVENNKISLLRSECEGKDCQMIYITKVEESIPEDLVAAHLCIEFAVQDEWYNIHGDDKARNSAITLGQSKEMSALANFCGCTVQGFAPNYVKFPLMKPNLQQNDALSDTRQSLHHFGHGLLVLHHQEVSKHAAVDVGWSNLVLRIVWHKYSEMTLNVSVRYLRSQIEGNKIM